MDSSVQNHEVENIVFELDDLFNNTELFTEVQLDKYERFSKLLKEVYRLTVASNFISNLKTQSLSELLVEGFDSEQIWQQIEIQNKAAVPYFSNVVSALNCDDVSFSLRRKSDQNISHLEPSATIEESSEEESHAKDEYIYDDDSDSSSEIVKLAQKREIENFSKIGAEEDHAFHEDDSSDFSDSDTHDPKIGVRQPKIGYKSKIDDQFFKLSELEEFLKIEDLKEEKKDDMDYKEENGIDLFHDIPSDDMDEDDDLSDNEGKIKKSSGDLMYEDFFDAPESGDESIGEQDNFKADEKWEKNQYEEMSEDDDNSLLQNSFSMQTDPSYEKSGNSHDAVNDIKKTAFEIEQEKIRQKIKECEQNMLEPLPWHLTGEVAAASRPVDSLIDKETDFDSNTKHNLIIDDDLTEKVENIITMAIINNAFSDVERKIKPTEEVIAQKKEFALDQAKSKKSLAQVYEEDYLKKQSKEENEEENPKHKEIKKLMDSLFPELHALFSHIPKPAIPEIKVISNLPAITVEEVAPTSVSDVTLLAPEEVKKKSGLVKGQTERTDTDRKRERRKKKIHQRLKEKKKQEKLAQADPSAKLSKVQKLDILKKLQQNRNTKVANVDNGGKIKSSKDFFSRLQDTVDLKKNKRQPQVKKKKHET